VLLLPYTASSVGVARRRLIADLISAGIFESSACDAALVLSELISNALRHASPLPGAKVKVAWILHRDSVEVAVSDGGGQTVPELTQPTMSSVGGRGLGIVARLSRHWGVRSGDGEMTVWAEVPAAPGGTARRGPSKRQGAAELQGAASDALALLRRLASGSIWR
jgi:anti-sigma regulatory factor (Ser/Thr protein kinase)